MSLAVRHFESTRFYVESETVKGRSYLVDLKPEQGFPMCNCKDFQTRIEPKLSRGIFMEKEDQHCKHIVAIVWFLGERCLEEIVKDND